MEPHPTVVQEEVAACEEEPEEDKEKLDEELDEDELEEEEPEGEDLEEEEPEEETKGEDQEEEEEHEEGDSEEEEEPEEENPKDEYEPKEEPEREEPKKEGLKEEEILDATMGDIEVLHPVTSPTETEEVTPISRIAELELQVRNLEQLVTKSQEEKEQSRGELMAELMQKKSDVRFWKYWAGCCFRRLKKVSKKLRHIKKKKAKQCSQKTTCRNRTELENSKILVFCRGKKNCVRTRNNLGMGGCYFRKSHSFLPLFPFQIIIITLFYLSYAPSSFTSARTMTHFA